MNRSIATLFALCLLPFVAAAPAAAQECDVLIHGYVLYCESETSSTGVLGSGNFNTTHCEGTGPSTTCTSVWVYYPGQGLVCIHDYPAEPDKVCFVPL